LLRSPPTGSVSRADGQTLPVFGPKNHFIFQGHLHRSQFSTASISGRSAARCSFVGFFIVLITSTNLPCSKEVSAIILLNLQEIKVVLALRD
jgi:hypothetical protein